MTERTYNRLANGFVLIAILSALSFDSSSSWHVVSGVIGILAGVTAVGLYFCNQSQSAAKKDGPEEQKEKGDVIVSGMSVPLLPATRAKEVYAIMAAAHQGQYAFHAFKADPTRLYVSHYAFNAVRRRHYNQHALYWYGGEELNQALLFPENPLSANQVAECAIEIMRHLSAEEEHDRWEFIFGPSGLRVIAKKGQESRRVPPQEDLDFGQLSTLVH